MPRGNTGNVGTEWGTRTPTDKSTVFRRLPSHSPVSPSTLYIFVLVACQMYTPSHPHSVYCLFVNFTPNSDGLQLVSTAPTAKHKQITRCHQWWGKLGRSHTECPKTSPLSTTSRPLFSSILSSYKLSSPTKHESRRISWP